MPKFSGNVRDNLWREYVEFSSENSIKLRVHAVMNLADLKAYLSDILQLIHKFIHVLVWLQLFLVKNQLFCQLFYMTFDFFHNSIGLRDISSKWELLEILLDSSSVFDYSK